ncbi:MAG: phosphonoacetaldehyde reductase [Lachnospiraceae bacterium]|nr:phosphonoacetaldehyde reductase [Lachnospiraceae bacterium]
MREQIIFRADNNYRDFDNYITKTKANKILLVCGNSISYLRINNYFKELEERPGIEIFRFSEFEPNPSYESVVKGVNLFKNTGCDLIIAAGGGSAMDVAKCIKLFAHMDDGQNYLKQEIVPNNIRLFAIPTTAGTGSEATRYAVIYYNGEKQSVSDYSCIPEAIVMDASVLETLPVYQKKATMLDALCHALESFWSVNSTPESRDYSKEAIGLILDNARAYLINDETGNANMLKASYIAGKAINITQTTAGHAMCYKLTTMYGLAHGHACALCVAKLWPFMLNNIDKCIDPRGQQYLREMFEQLAGLMNCKTGIEAAEYYQNFVNELGLEIPTVNSQADYAVLKDSVNPTRMKNNPVELTGEDIDKLYHEILR